jgi:hypothetical protein
MISGARVSALATACTALLMAGALAVPAGAQEGTCKTDVVTVSSQGKFRFFKNKELEGRGNSMADAVKQWEREVDAKFGERWASWEKAKDTSFNCAPTKTGKIIGSRFIACTISGRPCFAPAVAPPGGAVASDDDKDSPGRARRSGDRDEYEGTSWAYRREMQRQEYLLAQRNRSENYGWEREKARQRYLEAERDRTEARARERETARQRYWARHERYRWYDDDD